MVKDGILSNFEIQEDNIRLSIRTKYVKEILEDEEECDCDECCGCCECDSDDTEITEDTHGFTVSNSDENGYYSYSFYSTDKNLVAEMAKRFK